MENNQKNDLETRVLRVSFINYKTRPDIEFSIFLDVDKNLLTEQILQLSVGEEQFQIVKRRHYSAWYEVIFQAEELKKIQEKTKNISNVKVSIISHQ